MTKEVPTETMNTNAVRRSFHKIGQFAFHSLAATLGTMICASFLIYSLRRTVEEWGFGMQSSTVQQLLYKPYFPIQLAVAFIAGYLMMRRYGHAAILWAWIPPAIILGIAIATTERSLLEGSLSWRLKHFFGASCSPPACWDQVAYTATFYSGVAYAMGGLFQSLGGFRFDENPR
jgi:hypothetical protein